VQDIQLIYPQDLVQLTDVREIAGDNDERLLEISGEDFSAVGEVLINETKSPSVVVLGTTKLLVVVPDALGDDPVIAISVFSSRITLSGQSRIQFKLGDVTTTVSGMLRLMQRFLFLLFTSPGRDIFSPQLGGGILRMTGTTFNRREGSVLVTDFVLAVDRTARQLIALQAQERAPANERLLNAVVTTANFSREELALVTSVDLTNQAREVGTANVRL
jgi:hypothetical protein